MDTFAALLSEWPPGKVFVCQLQPHTIVGRVEQVPKTDRVTLVLEAVAWIDPVPRGPEC
jgi:hypothetical protein